MSLRNIAIIAHVDHGKTTLVDQMLAQSGVFRANEAHAERAMDSNDQERERGITILAKATSVLWDGAAGETRVNIIDTPGHADFGGEVERILGMVDGCLLLVDAEEGVMPQTKFVLGKALKLGLRPIVVLNKVDRTNADPDRVLGDAFDLFATMGATDEQLDFPHIYASGKQGWAVLDMKDEQKDLAPLFDKIVEHVPAPKAEAHQEEPARLLAVLIESMRREGFEVSISRPRVVFQTDPESGKRLEPIEEVIIDVDEDFTGIVIEKLSARKAELKDMGPSGAGKTRLALMAPSRALIGYQGEFLTDTRGSGVLNRVFSHYEPYKGAIDGRRNGVLISNSDGDTAAYALWNLEDRGTMFVGAGEKTYQGMIIGENAKPDDLDVNPLKAKQLTNVRASGKDEAIRLTPPRRMTLEQAIAYIESDELVEVTPKAIRLRKLVLNPTFRKRRVKEDA